MATRSRAALGLAAASAAALGVLLPTGADAESAPGTGGGVEQLITLGAPSTAAVVPLNVSRLAPGSTVSQQFRLHLAGHLLSATRGVRISHLRDLEGGCGHPEIADGDTTCGAGADQGELSRQLLAGVSWAPTDASGCVDAAGTQPTQSLAAFAGAMRTDPAASPAGADRCLTITLALPLSADNLVQSDGASFDLTFGLADTVVARDLGSGLGGGSAGTAQSATAGTDGRPAWLPFTGWPLVPVGLVALALAQVGGASLRAGRRGPRPQS